MGARVDSCEGFAPFVLRGAVDGREFYLRERHEMYSVAVAPDDHPDVNPWGVSGLNEIEVANGTSEDLCTDTRFDVARATEVAVTAVRVFLRRRDCLHASVPADAWFCPACGAPVNPAFVR